MAMLACATAFGMRPEHVLVEIVAQYDKGDGSAERAWTEETYRLLEPFSLPGGYPNLLGRDDPRVPRRDVRTFLTLMPAFELEPLLAKQL